jgi:hypothetical protein
MVCGGECEEMKRLRFFLLFACPVLLLIAVSGGWLRVQHRQYALDRQLIVALDYDEGKQALALVDAGADPNTPYSPPPAPSLTSLLNHLLRRPCPCR